MDKSPNIFSFFSGLGFLDLGFENSGYKIATVNEIHKPFLEAYEYSRNEEDVESYCCDVSDFLGKNIANLLDRINENRSRGILSGFIGGPPCPDFSIGGKNRGHQGTNGRLTRTYVELLMEKEPDFFVFENVKGLVRTKKHREFYDHIKDMLSDKFYLTDRLLNSIEFGAPQDRERIILIGINRDRFAPSVQLEKIDECFPWDESKVYPDRSAFELNWPSKDPFQEGGKTDKPEGIPSELTVQHWFDKNNVDRHELALKHFQPRQGLPRFQAVEEGDDSKKSFKRLHRWRYSPTACYGNNEVHLHPYRARRLSAAEALAIQTLPASFSLPPKMSLTNMFKGIGNGVPYVMAKGIATSLKHFLDEIS